jgi:hypothetical protein
MEKSAPYADTPIRVSVQSSVGMKYRTWPCAECGKPFLERDGDAFYRVGVTDMPEQAHTGADGLMQTKCGNCQQKYTVSVTLGVTTKRDGIPLYLQPESIFVVLSSTKKLRNVHCFECGDAFYSVSDRIEQIVDNVTPVELWSVDKMGPIEVRCKFSHCRQRWYVRV